MALRQRFLTGLIGQSIGQSLSPALHEAEGRAIGIDYSYRLFDIEAEPKRAAALPDILDRMQAEGFAGCNVTFPLKQAVMPLLDRLSPEAEAMGAVNTVRFAGDGAREGHNTDWWGFGENLRRTIPDAAVDTVALLGAGGAGAAAAYALCRMGTRELLVIDRDADKAEELVARLSGGSTTLLPVRFADAEARLGEVDGLVQATPIGMAKLPGTPISPRALSPEMWLAEIIYVPIETELLRAARALGCRTVDGGGMVVLQAARALEIFTGMAADPDRMQTHLLALLREKVG
ncbi:shikimate dehydrogenase [Sphingomonas sp. BIUV-7]|uniref:Shikimate dehydrogenase (NADP(+)) n=2 Tax=Sphingomonas natans TaxID=3063330 RepID=A0ABT8YB65_9SPHN|nr:shikimate dehydrogenase [Sphingomonas sp. BIUV-7]MDO6415576.1 shikimate dehydrogenase [Sphingomonas sp. BIUV-7]